MTDAEQLKRAMHILSSIAPDKVPGPFICGALGEPGSDGLHEAYMICPTFGADDRMAEIYRRDVK